MYELKGYKSCLNDQQLILGLLHSFQFLFFFKKTSKIYLTVEGNVNFFFREINNFNRIFLIKPSFVEIWKHLNESKIRIRLEIKQKDLVKKHQYISCLSYISFFINQGTTKTSLLQNLLEHFTFENFTFRKTIEENQNLGRFYSEQVRNQNDSPQKYVKFKEII